MLTCEHDTVGIEEYVYESSSWIMARSVNRINWMMVGVCSPSIDDERGIFTCSIPTSNEWDIQVQRLPNSKPNGTKGS